MAQGTIISKPEAQARVEAWQNTADADLPQTFTSGSSRILVYELYGDPFNAMLEKWEQTDEARFRLHAAVGESESFEVLLEIISGSPVTEIQADTLFVPALTSAGITVPDPEPTLPPQEIAPSEAKAMAEAWKKTSEEGIPASVTGSNGRVRYITYQRERSDVFRQKLQNTTVPKLLVFLGVKTPPIQARYGDTSDLLFTCICQASSDDQSEIPEDSFFEFGELCPPFCA